MDQLNAYKFAVKRIKDEKKFYSHLSIYVIFNFLILVAIIFLKDFFYDGYLLWNILSTPVLWGLFLAAHGITAFRKGKRIKKILSHLNLFEKWEEKKVKELMDKQI